MKSSYLSRNGHSRTKFAKKNGNSMVISRRKSALSRLENQLKHGYKNLQGQTIMPDDKAKARIINEISTLKSRI